MECPVDPSCGALPSKLPISSDDFYQSLPIEGPFSGHSFVPWRRGPERSCGVNDGVSRGPLHSQVPFVHLNINRLPRIAVEPCLQVLIRQTWKPNESR